MGKSIEELENDFWGEPGETTGLVKKVYKLRKKHTNQFTIEDLRFMISQDVGTQYLMPRALGLLEQNPLIWDLLYPGELLNAVLILPDKYWQSQPVHLKRTLRMLKMAEQQISAELMEQKAQREGRTGWYANEKPYKADFGEEMNEKLLTSVQEFLSKHQAD